MIIKYLENKSNFTLDASWHFCPVPILMTEEKIASMHVGEILQVIFTDPGAKPDLESWCAVNGQKLLGFRQERKKNFAYIEKTS